MKKIIILIYTSILFLGMFVYKSPNFVDLKNSNCKPFQNFTHPLGCNKLGKDILALTIYGSFSAILFSIPARVLTILLVLILCLFVFNLGQYFEILIESLSSVFLSIPSFLLALVIVYTLGQSIFTFLISIFFVDWAITYESIQAKIIEIKLSNYVLASKSLGANKFFIFNKHILPELISLCKVLFLTGIPSVIMTIAIFSFLGIDFGSEYFGSGLGEQIAFSKDYFETSILSILSPILAILVLLLVFTV